MELKDRLHSFYHTLNKMESEIESKGGPRGRTDNKASYNITKDIK
jgi:hypothetical protein